MTVSRTTRLARVIALLLVGAISWPGGAQRGDLEKLRAEITKLRQRLESVRNEAMSAERELQEADLELGIRTRQLELARAAENALNAELLRTRTEIDQLAPRLERLKKELNSRLPVLYRLGGLGYLRLLLTTDTESNPIEALSMLRYLVERDARTMRRFKETHAELEERQRGLAQRTELLAQSRAAVEQEQRAVTRAIETQQRLLTRLKSEEAGAAQQLATLEEKAARLQRLVDALSRQKRGLDPAIDIRSVRGALDWPVRGKVIEQFGRQRNPKFATFTINNGIRIEAKPSTEVRAVFQGTVLFSQWFKGYGNLIILDHGNRIFSLYGNVKAAMVAVGDRITTGQTIAVVAENEDPATGHLYFEIRQDNKPDDPRKWLR